MSVTAYHQASVMLQSQLVVLCLVGGALEWNEERKKEGIRKERKKVPFEKWDKSMMEYLPECIFRTKFY